jgi:adenosylcobinamide-GDP ribazoletransferase
MKKEIRIFLTAVMFLTRIRVAANMDHSPEYLRQAPRYFPVIGWIVGAVSALFYLVFSRFISVDAGILASMVAGVLVTGGFHEDGFADVCDGFGGGWTREKILAIMKDSRIGVYGAIGLIFVLGSKYVLLREMPAFTPLLGGFSAASAGVAAPFGPWNVFYDHRYIIFGMIAAHSLSRLMPVLVMQTSAYARADDPERSKSGAMAGQRLSAVSLTVACVFALAPFCFLPWHFLLVILPVLYATFELSRYFKRWIGGYTGDCLGAIQQVTEIIFYLGFLIIWRYF